MLQSLTTAAVAELPVTNTVVVKPARVQFLSATRGAALLYIVVDHVIGEFRQSDLPNPALWDGFLHVYDKLDLMTNGARLPILMVMTGLFLRRSLARGLGRFAVTRARSLLWPLLLWGVVQGFVFAVIPGLTPWGGQIEREGFVLLHESLTSFNLLGAFRAWTELCRQLWFLNMLSVFLVLYLPLSRLPGMVVLAAAAVWFLTSLLIEPPPPRSNPALTIFLQLGPYFLFFWLGTVISDWAVVRNACATPAQLVGAGCLFLAITLPLLFVDPAKWFPLTYLSALPAIPLMFSAGKWLAKSPVRAIILWAGEASLLLLCLHMLCIVLIIALARAVGLTSPPLIVVLAGGGGVGLCFGIDRLLRRVGLSAALGFRPAS